MEKLFWILKPTIQKTSKCCDDDHVEQETIHETNPMRCLAFPGETMISVLVFVSGKKKKIRISDKVIKNKLPSKMRNSVVVSS